MKTRSRFLPSAAVFVALAALFATLPAAAEHGSPIQGTVVAPPMVERFVMRAFGPPQPGREVRFRLVGVPGGQAWLEIPTIVQRVPMAETRPGVYEAVHVVRWPHELNVIPQARATLEHRGHQVMVTVAEAGDRDGGWGNRPHVRDNQPPQIVDTLPVQGDRISERGRTRISARLLDEDSGIEPSSVALRVDGRDVTGQARFDDDELRYRADLPPGRHVAEVLVRDRAGNANRRSWFFDVMDYAPGHGYGRPDGYPRW